MSDQRLTFQTELRFEEYTGAGRKRMFPWTPRGEVVSVADVSKGKGWGLPRDIGQTEIKFSVGEWPILKVM